MNKKFFFTFSLFFFLTLVGQAQSSKQKTSESINWKEPINVLLSENENKEFLFFDNASYNLDLTNLPYFNIKVRLSNQNQEIEIVNYETTPLSTKENSVEFDRSLVDNEVNLIQNVSFEQGNPYAIVSFIPLVNQNGSIRKITQIEFRIVNSNKQAITKSIRSDSYDNAPEISAMATGQWYKLAISETGIYKIDFNFLQSIGVNTSNLSSNSINIYGNGIGMLPFRNSVSRPNDIQANAIYLNDGGDGIFNQGDYLLFYGHGPHRWEYNESTGEFVRMLNQYTNEANYFLVLNSGSAKRINNRVEPSGTPQVVHTTFQDYRIHENDIVNIGRTGQIFLGEEFDVQLTRNFNFQFPNIVQGSELRVRANVGGIVQGSLANTGTWRFSIGGQQIGIINSNGIGAGGVPLHFRYDSTLFVTTANSPNITVQVQFQKNIPADKGHLDKISITALRPLTMVQNAMFFRNLTYLHPNNLVEYQIQDPQNRIDQIWDVTTPFNAQRINFQSIGSTKTFLNNANSRRLNFVAISGNDFPAPNFVGQIENQNLHALKNVEYLIVSPNQFASHANELADFHRQKGLTVEVVTLPKVYNEFSSGMRDVTAIRDLLRMLYKRALAENGTVPKYLLLYGDASYNNKSDESNNTNRVPSWQTYNSWSRTQSFINEDYFGLLDDNEGFGNGELVDVGIGRFPVNTLEESRSILNKVLNYGNTDPRAISSIDNSSLFGDWRNKVTFVSDDQNGEPDRIEGHVHMRNADQLARRVENMHPVFDVEKIYIDAYEQIITPGGERYPQANTNIRQAVERGTLLINYVGHGGPVGWAHERILDVNTIRNWRNFDRLSLFVTATCDFAPFDDPARISAGEWVLLSASGAGIALLTTTRTVFASQNQNTNLALFNYALNQEADGRGLTFGDMARLTKNAPSVISNPTANHRIFTLLGDPALRLALPRYNAEITHVNTFPVDEKVDTLKAMSQVNFAGRILNNQMEPLSSTSGFVSITVWDKEQEIATLNNAGSSVGPFFFNARNNSIFRGQSTVTNGEFNFSFIVPKNISYAIDTGKVTLYFFDGTTDGRGFNKQFKVGGSLDGEAGDNIGPDINMFLNNENFIPGGLTNPEPILIANLFDESGINTVGSGVGQDITAVLNRNTQNAIVLNQFYEADLDSYQSGTIRYQLSTLEEGPYTLSLRAWDVFNNSNQKDIDFIVANDEEMVLDHVLNYPNPFTTRTEFMFEHNQAEPFLEVRLQIFTISGRLVKTILGTVASDGFRNEPIAWDGRDDFGDRLARGVYIYKLRVSNSTGKYAEKLEKLVILN
jgi:hypothetical protein